MLPPLPADWKTLLQGETTKPYFQALDAFLDQEAADGQTILPRGPDIFHALQLTPFERVRVLLLGQDPYPNPGDAHGLCFSVRPEVRPVPRSLQNIYKELREDVGFRVPNHGCLEAWAQQGMLMLNTVLTVRAHQPNSHRRRGWEQLTDRIIEQVDAKPTRVVFVLWGKSAQEKRALIRQPHHRVVACAHPSPLSARRFFGCRCFTEINRHLTDAGLPALDWQIPDA